MKRRILASCGIMLLIFLLSTFAFGQSTDQLIISKDAVGPITQVSLSLPLQSNLACDQSQNIIPDGSKLISNIFSLKMDSSGIGIFQGIVTIIAPDGSPISRGFLQGTAGITAHRDAGKDGHAPGHLEGVLTDFLPVLAFDPPMPGPLPIWEINFSADLMPETAGPMPIYRAHLDGIIFSPISTLVSIKPDRQAYNVGDAIMAIINNSSAHPIQVFDEQSYCTIVQLQRQENDNWILIAGCPLARPPLPTIIASGETKQILLPPDAQLPSARTAGTYRLALTFTSIGQDGKPIADAATITSQQFRIDSSTSGSISMTTDQSSYRSDSSIKVTVTNGTDQDMVMPDHCSYCTILFLQRKRRGEWINMDVCQLMTPTRLIKIKAGQSMLVVLPPPPAIAHNQPGNYRIESSAMFIDSQGHPVGLPMVFNSSPFVIKRDFHPSQ